MDGKKNHLITDPITTNENKIDIKSERNWLSTFYTSKEGLLEHSSTTDIKNNRQERQRSVLPPLPAMITALKGLAPWPMGNFPATF